MGTGTRYLYTGEAMLTRGDCGDEVNIIHRGYSGDDGQFYPHPDGQEVAVWDCAFGWLSLGSVAAWINVIKPDPAETDVQVARTSALSVSHLWPMPDVMRRYLQRGDETARPAALAAADAVALAYPARIGEAQAAYEAAYEAAHEAANDDDDIAVDDATEAAAKAIFSAEGRAAWAAVYAVRAVSLGPNTVDVTVWWANDNAKAALALSQYGVPINWCGYDPVLEGVWG